MAPPARFEPMIVMKFGGTSVEDGAAVDRACDIVSGQLARRPLVVVSALAGTTNGLLQAAELASHGELQKAIAVADSLERRHAELLPSLAEHFSRLRELLRALGAIGERTPRTQDLIASYGEVLSSLIFTERLRRHNVDAVHVDARECIVTDDRFARASPLRKEIAVRVKQIIRPQIERQHVVVMGGYVGATTSGVTTTLGRGGSDYSAALVGAALDAEEIQIWTDVDGMLTADPHIVPGAWKVKEISFAEAAELAYFGARVLHPLTLLPAVEQGIPVFIYNSRKQPGTGTRIDLEARPCRNLIKSIACKKGITAITVTSSRMLMAYGFLRALFEVFERHRTPVDLVTTSEVSVSLTLDNTESLPAIVEDLTPLGDVHVDPDLSLICIVGDNIKYTPGIACRAFGSLGDINVHMISQGASNINLSFVVKHEDANTAIQRLHADFFREFDMEVFEPPNGF